MRAPNNANSLLELSAFCARSPTELPERISIRRKRMTKHLLGQSKRNRKTASRERSILKYGNHDKRVQDWFQFLISGGVTPSFHSAPVSRVPDVWPATSQ